MEGEGNNQLKLKKLLEMKALKRVTAASVKRKSFLIS
jgi:hypothetical protein